VLKPSPSWGTARQVCPTCLDAQHVLDKTGNVQLCPNCGPALLWQISRLPPEAKGARLSNLIVYPWLVDAIAAARKVVERPTPNWWFTLEGPFGVGKTALTYAILNECIYQRGAKAIYFSAFDAMQYVKAGFSNGTSDVRASELQDVPVLGLDEIGYNASEYDQKVLGQILAHRYARGASCLTVLAYNPPLMLPSFITTRIRDGRSYYFRLGGSDLRPHIRRNP
jgi:hypothetical protein